jgi:outer membrane protein OmpA-like peptidoglycan-associated protein
MKTFLWIFTILYFFFGWWWYVCPHKKVCPLGEKYTQSALSALNKAKTDNKDLSESPVIGMDMRTWDQGARQIYTKGWPVFKWGSAEAVIPPNFDQIRDSLVEILGEKNLLEITGNHFEDEEKYTELANLGLVRSEKIKALFEGFLPPERIKIKAEQATNRNLSSTSPFQAYHLKTHFFNEVINEIDDKTLIFFPYASADMLQNVDLNHYLDQVVTRVKNSGERIKLIGHTDSKASVARNMYLGKVRAEKIRDLLLKKGLGRDQITIESKGESQPMATNNTQEGRQKNRRVELIIIS